MWGEDASNVVVAVIPVQNYPTDIDRTLNEDAVDKILQYRDDYNNRPSHTISFMSVIASVRQDAYTVNL